MKTKLINDDCLNALKKIPDNKIDSMVTDPPAGISFMGKEWDHNKGGRDEWISYMMEIWKECYRVMKPGAHGFVWALPRTSHWTATSLENSGFEIRDIVTHIFASGFPKSLNIGKAVDKKKGILKTQSKAFNYAGESSNVTNKLYSSLYGYEYEYKSEQQWSGWGTGLKPASEHWILIRKPISEKTIVDNVLKWGTGGINIDDSRIGTDDDRTRDNSKCKNIPLFKSKNILQIQNDGGRFPANFIHDGSDEVTEQFPNIKSSIIKEGKKSGFGRGNVYGNGIVTNEGGYSDDGSASRFFYCSKASKSEKEKGLDGMEEKTGSELTGRKENSKGLIMDGRVNNPYSGASATYKRKNIHPTVKPIKLMKYLITMITPPNGVVLDPFMGSGSTGVACLDKYNFIGIEKEKEYFEIAEKRINIEK